MDFKFDKGKRERESIIAHVKILVNRCFLFVFLFLLFFPFYILVFFFGNLSFLENKKKEIFKENFNLFSKLNITNKKTNSHLNLNI